MPDKPNILIVDDETAVANITGYVLSDPPDWNVIIVDSPAKALTLLQEHEIAVVISDLKMPEYDGTVVLEQAARVNPSTVCILITAYATKEALIHLLNSGNLWRCVEKPWRPKQLRDLVGEAVTLYAQRRRMAIAEAQPAPAPTPTPTAPAPLRVVRSAPPPAAGGRVRVNPRVLNQPKRAYQFNKPADRRIKTVVQPATVSQPPPAPPPTTSIMSPVEAEAFLRRDSRYRDPVFLRQGGSGILFRAVDSLLDLPVAIKILNQDLTSNREATAALAQEARAAMQLSHKHIVRLHNIQQTDNIYYLVMEFIDGSTLRDFIQRDGCLSLETVAQIVDICEDALGYAHRHDVLHHDIKPDNLMISQDGILKIIDFGLACLADAEKSNEIRGTPYYMSPEEIRGDPLDQRSDIYSLAITLHELITGKLPLPPGVACPNLLEFVPEADASIPEPLHGVLAKAFAVQPDDRWIDIHEFAAAYRDANEMLTPIDA